MGCLHWFTWTGKSCASHKSSNLWMQRADKNVQSFQKQGTIPLQSIAPPKVASWDSMPLRSEWYHNLWKLDWSFDTLIHIIHIHIYLYLYIYIYIPTDILRAFVQYHCRQFLVRRQFWFINMYSLYANFYRHNAIRHKRPSYCRQSLHKMSAGIYIYVYIPPDIL